jgi:hypothetical protein
MSFGGIGVVHLAWTPALPPIRCGSDETGPGPFDHGVAFELGECGHDCEHGFAHRPFGVHTFGEATESDSARGQLVDDGKNMLRVASEPIQLPHGENVAFAEVVQAGLKLRSAGRGTADTVVGEHAVGPGLAHDAGNTTLVRGGLAILAALFDRLGRQEPAATIAGFAVSPLTSTAIPEINTAITHLRDVLGDRTYESLARKGETMTTAAIATYAFDHIDQARAELGGVSE